MNLIRQTAIKRLAIWAILLLLLTTCSDGTPAASPTTKLPVSPMENLGDLSADAILTLRSLEKIDDYPFYSMHFYGDYEYPQIGSTWTGGSGFSCSLFAALGKAGDMIYGRNFDWDFSPALILFTDPPDGYASAAMVDLTFLGISPTASSTLIDLPIKKRTALLAAPSMPFDGMNEYGLTIGMAAVPDEFVDEASYDPNKPTIGSIGIIRQSLDQARNVDEAVKIFEQYNIDFSGGPPIHYLLADPSGKAVLIEFYKGDMMLLPNESPWHMATNHLRCIAKGDGGCPRYRTISDRLTSLNGQFDSFAAMQLLSDVKQDITQWSTVYNMTRGDIQVVISGGYDIVYSFILDRLVP